MYEWGGYHSQRTLPHSNRCVLVHVVFTLSYSYEYAHEDCFVPVCQYDQPRVALIPTLVLF